MFLYLKTIKQAKSYSQMQKKFRHSERSEESIRFPLARE